MNTMVPRHFPTYTSSIWDPSPKEILRTKLSKSLLKYKPLRTFLSFRLGTWCLHYGKSDPCMLSVHRTRSCVTSVVHAPNPDLDRLGESQSGFLRPPPLLKGGIDTENFRNEEDTQTDFY